MLQSIEQQFVRTARPLYAHLVTLLEGAIARGDLPSGSRLPPERELASRLRISRTTVVSAYRELESRGLLRGYVGRGTFVCASPEPTGAPFAWRGKIAAAALRSSDSTLRDTMRHSSDARLAVAGGGRAGDRLFPDRGLPQGDRPRADARRARGLASRSDRRATGRCARRSPSASACRPRACWSSPARSRGSICSRAA